MPINTGTTSACDGDTCQNFPVLWDNYPAYSSGQVVAEFVVGVKHGRGLRFNEGSVTVVGVAHTIATRVSFSSAMLRLSGSGLQSRRRVNRARIGRKVGGVT
jgi:hypothetical protein